MKIVLFDIEPWERSAFDRLARDNQLVFVEQSLDAGRASARHDADVISTFRTSRLDEAVLSRFDHLKMIATRSTGVDHIDLTYCEKRGITVCNVPEYGTHTVAEHVFALLLAISHRVIEAAERTRRGDFSIEGLRGFDLDGKTIGVVGTGHIGRCVIDIARGFGMKVVAFDRHPDPDFAARRGFDYLPLNGLLATSDVVTLHVPAAPETHHLIGRAQLARMKDGAVLINTARGSLVDSRALVRALGDGKLAAAGLDVLEEEPILSEEAELLHAVAREEDHPAVLLADMVLLHLPNVVVTPHTAFYTREAERRIIETTAKNIEDFLAGGCGNVVGRPVRAAGVGAA